MSIIITGFSSFPGVATNPTELLIEEFQHKPPLVAEGEMGLTLEVLDTQYTAAGDRISGMLQTLKPRFLLMFGVAESRQTIALERFAINIDDCASPDASGDVRRGRRIEARGPAAYETRVDLYKLREYLLRDDIDVEISNHAGTYVCNHAYYVALHAATTLKLNTQVLFVHIPLVPNRRLRELILSGTVKATRADVETLISHLIRC